MTEQVRTDSAPRAQLRVQRIRPAYQQVADELRRQIVGGVLVSGARLPAEAELTKVFGVSRGTVREALRVLASQNLIETRRGVTGGSFVSAPDPERVAAAMGATLGVLMETPKLRVEDLLEARLLLEPVAARLAAQRADAETVAAVVAAADAPRRSQDPGGFAGHLDFHTTILVATGNLLFTLMGQPVADVLRTRLQRVNVDRCEWDRVDGCHRVIARRIAAGEADAAAQAMEQHLLDLRLLYQRTGSW